MPGPKLDWSAIYTDWCAGRLSNRELAAKHGCSEGAIRRRAKAEGWTRTAAHEPQSPLGYMLSVMNDPDANARRRDRMAVAAAPFVHSRASDQGKKGQRQEDADRAAQGDSEWGSDLVPGSGKVH